jgi:hypothetical protein
LIPAGGPSFPNNDELFWIKNPELLDPKQTPNAKNRDPSNLYLVRFGDGPESQDKLAKESAMAQANGYPYGVSTFLRDKIPSKGRYAPLLEVMKKFQIVKTGSPDHYTVTFLYGVTPQATAMFNNLFIKR